MAVGLENSGVVVEAFLGASSLTEASWRLHSKLAETLVPLDGLLGRLCVEAGVRYSGMDTSVNPSLEPQESLVLAYESVVGEGRFGRSGSLVSSSLPSLCYDLSKA